ncbi:MAG: cytochrome c [Alphaproteobacteria bacterium]|nr:cytochrome c [Alphaproteobacteria bacterium]
MRQAFWLRFFAAIALTLGVAVAGTPAAAQSSLSAGYAAGDARLTPAERAGKEIWFFATAFNDRFFTYSYPQRLGATIDWYKILGAPNRGDLFQAWGAIPDPDCCVPGTAGCKAKSLEETYGFLYCPGDDALLKSVGSGKDDYRDPGCDFQDSPYNMSTPHGPADQRQDKCDLRFGTSTGALGLRKFPNPRFDPEAWRKLNGSLASWEGYRQAISPKTGTPDSRTNRLFDGAVEPPFRIGMACGACHIAYDPNNPPANMNEPKWENIDGLVGNQYSRVSQMLGSGLQQHRLEWQLIAVSRPGVVDTSALPMDTVMNPGTMNAIINLAKRPLHEHEVTKWRKAASCPAGADEASCWCEPDKPGKCWERSTRKEMVHNILKGGEDSVGALEAIQRVYFNIGSCAEQCWMNHIPDLRVADPQQRNYGQTPFDIGQCRRDCASFRAIEDRLEDVAAFFFSARPTDLWKARRLDGPKALEAQLEREHGSGAIATGRRLFAQNCAGCHSSQTGPYDNVDFHAVDPRDPTLRLDFLSSDRPILATRIGTYRGRSLHSNHMPTRVWEQYASQTLHQRPADPAAPELLKGSGRGYYRPVSLLSVWAHAPFMHNNAIGPEICGKPSRAELDLYVSPYVDAQGRPAANPPGCWPFDPSVEGRYKLFVASMEELLWPDRRPPKRWLTDREIVIDVAPDVKIGDLETGLSLKIPPGFPVQMLNSLRYKDMLQDMVLAKRNPAKLTEKYASLLQPAQITELRTGLLQLWGTLARQAARAQLDITKVQSGFIQRWYSNSLDANDNAGHRFGERLSDAEKRALIAFLATL